ncbi:MAG TPA: DUF2961 domain-containing protein [Candidatus Hydrogenedentes bacterium]|nr:DUF2961 domain-containing protein [Candidatus Hydrogenedentota bacterium]HIJ74980.1 DUF2961 domain-containing protein [Candidatus Hydrogenedentota bacterium]
MLEPLSMIVDWHILPALALAMAALLWTEKAHADKHAVPIGAEVISDLAGLPLLREGVTFVGTSSHDVTGGNNDGFEAAYSYLYKDGDEYVLFEEEGPGCVYVVRTIGHKGNLLAYLEGSEKPSFTMPFVEMHSGEKTPFVKPFVGKEDEDHGSSWSYVPIPYTTGCKLTTDEMEKPHFLTIFAHKYRASASVAPFDPALAVKKAFPWWANPDKPPHLAGTKELTGVLRLAPRGVSTVADLSGAGAVTQLKLRFPDGALEHAGKVVLRAYWDGRPAPHIDSPVSTFFALGCPRALDAVKHADPTLMETDRYIGGTVQPRSLFVGQDQEGWLYCRFPMPYWKSARIDLLSCADDETIDVEFAILHEEAAYPENAAYFNAHWRQENPLRFREDFCVLDTRGQGHYVGCVITFSTVHRTSPYNQEVFRGHLEGDARFYVDDSRTPVVASTGTEEYFNWGWYDTPHHDKPFAYPTHGYPLHVVAGEDHCVMYRFHVGDVVPYARSFRFDLEHGGGGEAIANYSATAFFYQRDVPALVLTDEVDIGDAASESAHAYTCEGAVREEHRTLPYEGSYQLPKTADAPRDRAATVKDTGRVWSRSCTFTVAISPDNAGVRLRRRSYYGFDAHGDLGPGRPEPLFTDPQRVTVSADGAELGDWYIPAGHARDTWRDTDFELPGNVTQGKERVTVTLTAKNGARWDEYTYWVYVYTAGQGQ